MKRSRANLFLSVLLISLSFSIAHIIVAGQVFNHLSLRVYSFGDPTFFLIAPLLRFYVCELTGQRIRMNGRVVLHFSPFLLIIILSLMFQTWFTGEAVHFLNRHHRLTTVVFWVVALGFEM